MQRLPQLFRSKQIGNDIILTNNKFRNSLNNWMNRINPK